MERSLIKIISVFIVIVAVVFGGAFLYHMTDDDCDRALSSLRKQGIVLSGDERDGMGIKWNFWGCEILGDSGKFSVNIFGF